MQVTTFGAETAEVRLDAVFSRVGIRIIPLLCCCYLAAYLDRINVGFAKLGMLADVGFSEAVFGLGAGMFFVGYILFEVPSNLILTRVGARRWIARIMISWGMISALGAFVHTPSQFYAVRFLLGVAEAGFLPGVLFFLTQWFPSYRRSRIIALFMIGLPLSSIVGAPLSGWIMGHFSGFGDLAAWQWLFLLEALPSVILGILILCYLPDAPAQAKWLSDAEKASLQAALDEDDVALVDTPRHPLRGLADIKVWMLGGIDFAILLSTYALGFWLPTMIRAAGTTDPSTIGLLTAIPSVGALAGMLIIGSSSDRRRERRWHIIAPVSFGAVMMVLGSFAGSSVWATVLIYSAASAAIIGAIPVFFSLPATFLSGPAAAMGFAMACSLANIAGLVSNLLLGVFIASLGRHVTMAIFGAFLLAAAGLVAALPKQIVNR